MKNSIVGNSIFNSVYKMLNVICPFFISIYVARILMPEGVGQVGAAQNVVSYFTFGAALGIPIYGVRIVAQYRNECKELNKRFSELFIINALSTVLFTVAYFAFVFFFSGARYSKSMLFICGLPIYLNIFNIDWLYQGLEKYKYIACRSMIVKAISLISVLLLVKDKSDVLVYAFIVTFATCSNYILNMFGLKRNVHLDLKGLELKRHIKAITVLFFSSLAIELYTMVDITMLTYWWGDATVGIYSNAMKIVKIIITFLAAISAVALPRFSLYARQSDSENIRNLAGKMVETLVFISIPATVGLIMISHPLIPLLYGEAFIEAVGSLRILSLLIVPITLSTFCGAHLLCAIGLENKMLYAVIVGAIVNIMLNFVLIPTFAQKGAAIASVISEWVVCIVDFRLAKKYTGIEIGIVNIVKVVLGTMGMFLVIRLIKKVISIDVLFIVSACLVGVGVFVLLEWLLKNKMVINALKKIKR